MNVGDQPDDGYVVENFGVVLARCGSYGFSASGNVKMAPKAPEPPPAAPEPNNGPYWFTVKYGQGEKRFFNCDCWAVVLLDYMKERCGYGDLAEPVELKRKDGSTVGLLSMGKALASEAIKPKEVCTLCKVVQSDDPNVPPIYEPLYTPAEGEEVEAAPPPPPAGKKK